MKLIVNLQEEGGEVDQNYVRQSVQTILEDANCHQGGLHNPDGKARITCVRARIVSDERHSTMSNDTSSSSTCDLTKDYDTEEDMKLLWKDILPEPGTNIKHFQFMVVGQVQVPEGTTVSTDHPHEVILPDGRHVRATAILEVSNHDNTAFRQSVESMDTGLHIKDYTSAITDLEYD